MHKAKSAEIARRGKRVDWLVYSPRNARQVQSCGKGENTADETTGSTVGADTDSARDTRVHISSIDEMNVMGNMDGNICGRN